MNTYYLKHSKTDNSKRTLIKEALKMEEHNLICYSANFETTKARIGYTDKWDSTKERLAILSQMYNEIPDKNGYCTYIGTILDHFFCSDNKYVKFELLAPDSEKHREIFYFKINLLVETNTPKISASTNDFLSRKLIAIRVKGGIIEHIKHLEQGEI